MSREDRSVVDLWNEECKFVNGKFEIPIPWRSHCRLISSNIIVALSRLEGIVKTLRKKGKYELYDDEMKKLVEGYAESISIDRVPKAAWFLPHHGVTKNIGDLRIVFDCASKFQGMSLKDRRLQGPDLNYFHVLIRFRQYEYVFMGDVTSMYYQVKIPEKDRDALCILWYDAFGDVVEMRMTCHVFGGVWCASSSTYALCKAADLPSSPEVVHDLINR